MPEMVSQTLSESSNCCILSPPLLDRLTAFWSDACALSDRIILSLRRSGEWGVTRFNTHFQRAQGAERDDLHYIAPNKG
jgi:hypothetical protein